MIKRQNGQTGGNRETKPAAEQGGQRRFDQHGGTTCEACGNGYDKPIEIVRNGISHYFDCFECAIHVMAPKCAHCGVRIIGHGHETGGQMFCCAHCATKQGVTAMVDRV